MGKPGEMGGEDSLVMQIIHPLSINSCKKIVKYVKKTTPLYSLRSKFA